MAGTSGVSVYVCIHCMYMYMYVMYIHVCLQQVLITVEVCVSLCTSLSRA